ncbi:MAG: magnesium transporter [Betaproteobacteria bacterium RIFCSPLOWO2_02_FULL_67_26]|nr:MAG: magnesium transporter [Betaproteobacteria bacterium RIFCSPLOWO2_02_FULL_67_26]
MPEVKARSAPDAAVLIGEHPAPVIAAVLLEINPGFAQDILAELPGGLADAVMQAASSEFALQWQRNQTYAQASVGRLMEPAYAVFHPAMTVAQTVDRLRALLKVAFITYGYVIDENGSLCGLITMRDLLFADDDARLETLMHRDVFTLRPETPLNEAMKQVLDRHYPVYPVCDANGVLLGLVRGQAMFEEQAFEITAQVGTTFGVEKEERLVTPIGQSFKFRHPWLQLNLLTAFAAGAVVALFQDTVDRLVILALFLPILAGQSGNTGCQALAVTLRGMTLGELKAGKERSLVTKEAWLGFYNGSLTGLVAGLGMLLVAVYQGSPNAMLLGLVVWIALVGACVISGVCGAMIPLTLKRFGLDPATASSIFLTTATDVVSMGMLLGLATLLIR